jgi:hypothetical protein
MTPGYPGASARPRNGSGTISTRGADEMKSLEEIIKTETAEDLIKALVRNDNGPDLPQLDRLFSKYRELTMSSGELMLLYDKMIAAGIIIVKPGKGESAKGPNWTEPDFIKNNAS